VYEIRTVTVHYGKTNFPDIYYFKKEIEGFLSKIEEAIDDYKNSYNIKPTYLRISFPNPIFYDEIEEETKQLEEFTDRFAINLGQISSDYDKLEDIIKEIASDGMYASILLERSDWETAIKISKALHSLVLSYPVYGTNIGINTLNKKYFVTPYYPLASAIPGKISVSTALTYPNYLRDSFIKNGFNGLKDAIYQAGKVAEDLGNYVANHLNIGYEGVDLSVSPWMEESSLGLVEMVSSTRMPKPGFANGLRKVNESIIEVSEKIKTTGFNEVMLPVAEDSKLKARVSEGEVKARDLVMYSGVCLAGLDLAVVPSDINGVAGLILDTSAYARTKNRVLGVRIIPVDSVDPGDKIDLGKFGETPVIGI
jgi:uncharacterized protein (UPF0210 family)